MTTLKLNTLSARIQAHKMALVHIVKPPVCTERARHYTEMYQRHLDKPIPVRRALALAHHLAERTIWIKHDELIVGNQASEVRAAPIFPEYTVSWIEKEIDDLADRPGAGFSVSEENKRVLHEVCPWWRGQTVQDRCYGMFTDEQKALLATGIIKAEGNMTSGDAHLAVNYPLLLEKGLDGMRAKVAERRSRINLTVLEDLHGEQFLKAIDIVLEAVSDHSKRFAALAREMATAESRESRRHELLTIAENCDVIAHEPPKTFWQALQLCYFIQLILQIESNGHSVSFGRMDQYLYPYYRRDVELQQSLDREQAIELLHSCWLKLLEVNKIRSGSHSKASAGSPLYQNVTIGGQNLVEDFANCSSSEALVFAGLVTVGFLLLLYLPRRVIGFKDFMNSVPEGGKLMMPAILILVLAWTLKGMTDALGIGTFVRSAINLNSSLMNFVPLVIFCIAIFIAFSSGTSWGTFAIFVPIVVNMFAELDPTMMIISVAAVLAGAVCGDHISPISDTTIMSSSGAQSNHINHVQTQMQYAFVVIAVCAVGYLIAGFTENWWLTLLCSLVILTGVLLEIRKREMCGR